MDHVDKALMSETGMIRRVRDREAAPDRSVPLPIRAIEQKLAVLAENVPFSDGGSSPAMKEE
jgi:hypothetical protein